MQINFWPKVINFLRSHTTDYVVFNLNMNRHALNNIRHKGNAETQTYLEVEVVVNHMSSGCLNISAVFLDSAMRIDDPFPCIISTILLASIG